MEGLSPLILDLALILVSAGIITVLFRLIKLPAVLGYIAAGILISPNIKFLPTVANTADIDVWADIGIIFLMFALGLEFSFHKITEVGKSALITTSVVMISMLATGTVVGRAMGLSMMNCVFLGGMLSMSSTMIILKSYEDLKLKEEGFAKVVLGALVIEDIAGIFMMIVLTTLSVSKSFSGVKLASELGILLLILVVILCLGIFIIPTLLNKIKNLVNDEILLIISLALCMGMVALCTRFGFSEALGAFLAGSIIAGTGFSERIEVMIQPVKNMFGAIFFVSVGMMVNPPNFIKYIVPILILTAVTMAGQMFFSALGAFLSGQNPKTSIKVGFSMVQIGEFSFILASLGTSLGVMDKRLHEVIIFVAILTIFFTPVFIKNGERVSEAITGRIPEKWMHFLNQYSKEKTLSAEKDRDWNKFIKENLINMIICLSAMVIIYLGGKNAVLPVLLRYSNDIIVNIILAGLMIMCMAPFINILCRKKSVTYQLLWRKNSANKIILIALRALNNLISAVFVGLVIKNILIKVPVAAVFIVAAVITVYFAKSDLMRGVTLDIEARFISNFNERLLADRKKERTGRSGDYGIPEDVFVIEFPIREEYDRRKVSDLILGKYFRISLIQMVRADGSFVNQLNGDTVIKAGDVVSAAGSRDQIDAYRKHLIMDGYDESSVAGPRSLAEHIYSQVFNNVDAENQLICVKIPVTKEMSMYRTPIKSNNFRKKYKGSIIGIERGHLPILSQNPNFRFMEGDIIWSLGTREMMDVLLKEKLISEKDII